MTGKQVIAAWLPLIAFVAVALAGCAPSNSSVAHTPTQTPLPVATETPTASQSANDPGFPRPCSGGRWVAAQVGDLAISAPAVLYGYNADYMLPDNLPLDKPLVVTVQNNQGYLSDGKAIESRTVIQAAFVISVCNLSSVKAHRLTNYGVMLDTLVPYTGKLNAINGCAELYGPTPVGGECAGGYSPDVDLSFQMPDSAAGAVVTQTSSSPIELPPGYGLDLGIGVTPAATGFIATFRLSASFDGNAVTYPVALRTQPELEAPVARRWAGNYCENPQMQALIPATIPPNTYYACPQS
ncbi:MAG TPA: hypothetical protein VF808_03415 [Ktedonobacterales bacterium]